MSTEQEKWEKAGIYEPGSAPSHSVVKRPYKAFGVVDNRSLLWLKPEKGEPGRALAYRHLNEVVIATGVLITLDFAMPDRPYPRPVSVWIQGQHLEPLTEAIIEGKAAWIQVFGDEFELPEGEEEPLVREIIICRSSTDVPPPRNERN